jgi:hypothetical protein
LLIESIPSGYFCLHNLPDFYDQGVKSDRLLADLPKRARQAVEFLDETLAAGDVPRAREEIRSKVGSVTVEANAKEIRLYGQRGALAASLLRAVGANASAL